MSFKKFNEQDLLFSTIKTKPKFQFRILNGQVYLNNNYGGAILNELATAAPVGDEENTLNFSNYEESYNIALI